MKPKDFGEWARSWAEDVCSEYESAAESLAKRGLSGKVGDPLPENLSEACHKLINDDPEAFETRVRDYAYAIAMEKHDIPED